MDKLFLKQIVNALNSHQFWRINSTCSIKIWCSSWLCGTFPLNSKMVSVHRRLFSRATIKRAYIQIMVGIKRKTFNVLFKKNNFSLNNKIRGSSTAANSPFTCSIHPKCQSRKVDLISLYLYNNAAQFNFTITHSIQSLQPVTTPFDYRFNFCLENSFKVDHDTVVWNPPFCWGGFKLLSKF